MAKIGIIGCGYVGQHCAIHWLSKGHQVSVTTRQKNRIPFLKSLNLDVHLVENEQALTSFIQQQEIILICVAPTSLDTYSSTYLQVANSVKSTAYQSPKLQQVIYTSSTSVYGDHQGGLVDEHVPVQATSPQTDILIQAEDILLQTAHPDLRVCIYRLGEIYGPGREIVDRLRQSKPLPGNGQSITNIIHLHDIVQACDFAVLNQLTGVFNLCNDDHYTRAHFYAYLCKVHNLLPVQWDPHQKSRHGGNKCVSNKKLKRLGFTFGESFGKSGIFI